VVGKLVSFLGGRTAAIGWGAALTLAVALALAGWRLKAAWTDQASTEQQLSTVRQVAVENAVKAQELRAEMERVSRLQARADRIARQRRARIDELNRNLQEDLSDAECTDTPLPAGAADRLRGLYAEDGDG